VRLSPPHRPRSLLRAPPLTTMPLSWARATSPESTGAAFGVEWGTSARVSFQGPNTVAYEAIPSSDESETMLSNVLLRSAVRVLCREKEELWLLQIVRILMMRGYTYVSSVFYDAAVSFRCFHYVECWAAQSHQCHRVIISRQFRLTTCVHTI